MSERQQHLKRQPDAPKPSHTSPLSPLVRSGTLSGGQTLDKQTQASMSAQFGHDFSQVRIHTDAHAGESAEAMGASAYAHGSDIVFAEGRYTPGSRETERLLAHELTHVVQQAQHGPGDTAHASDRDDASEREAENAAGLIQAGQSVQVQAAPQAALARAEDGNGSWFSTAWDDTKAAAGAVYNGYEKATDFKALESGSKDPQTLKDAKGKFGESFVTGGLNGEIDSLEKSAAAGNQKMVDDAQGHWYSPLAEGAAWVNSGMTQATGGLVKGGLDVGLGMVNAVAHPIDAAAGLEGIAEHDLPMVGSVLKAGHGLYDLAANGGGQYGNSLGELGNHLFNPMQQMEDDKKFNTDLATNIIAPDKNPDGTTDWSAWKNKPIEAAVRAATNIAPVALGVGEAAAGEGGAEAARVAPAPAVPEIPEVPSPVSPLATTGEFPQPVSPVAPPEIDPFGKTEVPAPADVSDGVARTRNPVQQMTPVDPAQMFPGAPQPPGFQSGPVMPSAPEFGTPEWGEQLPAPDSVPDTDRGMPSMPGVGPGRTPTLPGVGEPGPALPAQGNVPEALSAPRPSQALTGDGVVAPEPAAPEPVDDPGDIHKRKTGDRASDLPPSGGPDPDHPFFDPRPEPSEPSVEELLEGLNNRPASPTSDPLGPLLD